MRQLSLIAGISVVLISCGTSTSETDADALNCQGNLKGTVTAHEEVQSATDVREYRYEYDQTTGMLSVDLRDENDVSLAVMELETAGPSAAMYTAAGKPKEIGPGRSRIVASDGSEIEFFRTSAMNYTGFGTRDINGRKTLLGSGVRHSQNFVAEGKRVEILYLEDAEEKTDPESLSLVVEALDGQEPSQGETFDRIVVADEGGWEVVRHHRLDLSKLDPSDEELGEIFETFLVETGYEVFVGNAALDYWRVVTLDPEWQKSFGAHLGTCVSGEQFDRETLRPIASSSSSGEVQQQLEPNWEACENMFFGAMGFYSLAGLCVAALRVYPMAAVVACPVAAYAGFRMVRSTVRCMCTSYEAPRDYNVVCADCNPSVCAASCAFKGRETCGDPIVADGQCVREEEPDVFGLYDSWCSCVIVGPNQAGPGALLSDEDVSCSSGDPHILTFDGLRYSSHSAGEFIAVITEDEQLEIQVRHETWRSDTCDGLAVNTAVAVRIGDSVASFYVREDEQVRLNGEPITFKSEPVAVGDARMDRIGNGVLIETHRGDSVFVALKTDSIDVTFSPAKDRKQQIEGLFGTYNENPDDDLRSSEGLTITSPFTNELLHEAIVSSWAVTSQNTLFHYADGDSPETFQQGLLSVTEVSQLPPALEAEARLACVNANVHQTVLDACTLDVACTGDNGFADSHPTYAPTHVATQSNSESFAEFGVFGDPIDWTPVDGSPNRIFTLGDIFYPTFFVSDESYTRAILHVSVVGNGTDALGLVLGWNQPEMASSTYYETLALVWIAESDTVAGLPVEEGLHLVRVDGDFPDINDLRLSLWAPEDPSVDASRVQLIESAYGPGLGWVSGQLHQVVVAFDEGSGVVVRVGDQIVLRAESNQLPTGALAGRIGLMTISSGAEFSNLGIFPTDATSFE